MKTTTESLIASLTEEMVPVKPAAPPVQMFVGWIVISLVYVAIILCFSGLRHGLWAHLHMPLYLAEILLLVLLVFNCGKSAMVLSFPDDFQRRNVLRTPAILAALFVGLMAYQYVKESPLTPMPPHGLECLLCICMYTFVPALLMIAALRKQASSSPATTGCLALIASCSLGCLAIRLCEDTDSIHHLVTWHYLPMAGFALIGVYFGKKVLKW